MALGLTEQEFLLNSVSPWQVTQERHAKQCPQRLRLERFSLDCRKGLVLVLVLVLVLLRPLVG